MQSNGTWKLAASVFVGVCLMWTQLELNVLAEDVGNELKIAVDGGRFEAGREIRVNVRNADVPASGAKVVFNLPQSGPGGVFSNGARSVSVLADAKGLARSGNIHLNSESGPFSVLVMATQGGSTNQISVPQSNRNVEKARHSSLKKWLLIGAGLAGAVAVIVLVQKSKPEPVVTVGAPTVVAPQ